MKKSILFAFFLTFLSSNLGATVWYVDHEATCTINCGSTWATAFDNIQDAIDAADTGEEIWVKMGSYSQETSLTVEPVNVDKPVSIYGGFDGTETERIQRDWVNNVTIVDGQGSAKHCFYITDNATIDGFSITGGNAFGSGDDRHGGGVFNKANSFINNCLFTGNHADDYHGGGVYTENSSLSITNCIFAGNSGGKGGGLYSIHNTTEVINCTFSENSALYGGGGIRSTGAGSMAIANSILWGNTTSHPDRPDEIYNEGPLLLNVDYNDIDQDGFAGSNGNIRQNPLFIGGSDYHLKTGSPCIDAGSPVSDYSNEPEPNGCRINMGAYGNTEEATVSSEPDGDGVYGACDNCPDFYSLDQTDSDGDGLGNVCDNCPDDYNPAQEDTDADLVGDICDDCTDTDGDGYGNPGFPENICPGDNCPDISNPDQTDSDGDGLGNICDNCPDTYNPGQEDSDDNGIGDACDLILVELSSFTASPLNAEVLIEWSTESEIDNAGFNIYRSESEEGDYLKITDKLIPAEGSPALGAYYKFVDEDVENRKTYYYKLEDIDLNGVSTLHGPVGATPRRIKSTE